MSLRTLRPLLEVFARGLCKWTDGRFLPKKREPDLSGSLNQGKFQSRASRFRDADYKPDSTDLRAVSERSL
jgi:hypothetical protein